MAKETNESKKNVQTKNILIAAVVLELIRLISSGSINWICATLGLIIWIVGLASLISDAVKKKGTSKERWVDFGLLLLWVAIATISGQMGK